LEGMVREREEEKDMSMREKVEHEIEFHPCTVKDLKRRLSRDKAGSRKVMEAVDELVHDGVICQREGVFFTVRSGRADKLIPCKIVKLGKNFGFAMRDDATGDLFIPGRCLMGAMPGDKVLVEKFAQPRVPGSDEGEVIAITEQQNNFVGTARRIDGRLVFVPDVCAVMSMQIAKDCDGGAHDGDKVAVEILSRGRRHDEHQVGVAMRFGSADEAKQCAKALLYAQDISRHFSDKVKAEAKKYEDAEVKAGEIGGRMDLRTVPIFTIDSAETKDIDDAINVLETNDGFELGVHIADVSHYVKPGSELDEEAFRRGTSVYYADQVVPMLPRQLSNGVCSLNEKELRLAFSCLMKLDKQGNLTDYRFVKSVICSRVKGVYSEINDILADNAEKEIQYKYAEVVSEFPAMRKLYSLRKQLRKQRGCMEIESGECKLILDEDGHCIDVKKRTQGESEAMVEEFMLLANQCAAHFARTRQAPFVYRVHEEPNGEKLERLHKLLQTCGINDHFAGDVPEQKELSAILDGARGTPYEKIIHTGLLRCMAKARYEEKPKGHYGLVLSDYAHFTSPIRRYPDLAIHRILTDMIGNMPKAELAEKYTQFAIDASKQASEREVVAMQIERSAEDCYKAEYARNHIGQHFEGTISGVTQRGVFVELENTVEGFVPAGSLTPRGTLLTEGVRLSDPADGKSWSLGDSIMIMIVKADVNLGRIDFEAVKA
jgi:ribonuclease R